MDNSGRLRARGDGVAHGGDGVGGAADGDAEDEAGGDHVGEQGASAVGDEGQRDADDRRHAGGHVHIDHGLEEDHGGESDDEQARKGVLGAAGDFHGSGEEGQVEDEDEEASDEAPLGADDGEDEVGVGGPEESLADVLCGLGALSGEAAGADGDFGLALLETLLLVVGFVGGAGPLLVDGNDALLLVGLEEGEAAGDGDDGQQEDGQEVAEACAGGDEHGVEDHGEEQRGAEVGLDEDESEGDGGEGEGDEEAAEFTDVFAEAEVPGEGDDVGDLHDFGGLDFDIMREDEPAVGFLLDGREEHGDKEQDPPAIEGVTEAADHLEMGEEHEDHGDGGDEDMDLLAVGVFGAGEFEGEDGGGAQERNGQQDGPGHASGEDFPEDLAEGFHCTSGQWSVFSSQ